MDAGFSFIGEAEETEGRVLYGMSDLVNEMTNITETPGCGYQVVNGAATLTEDWEGWSW